MREVMRERANKKEGKKEEENQERGTNQIVIQRNKIMQLNKSTNYSSVKKINEEKDDQVALRIKNRYRQKIVTTERKRRDSFLLDFLDQILMMAHGFWTRIGVMCGGEFDGASCARLL